MRLMTEIEGIVYYEVNGELIFFRKTSSEYKKWSRKKRSARIMSLRCKELIG